MKSPDTWSWNFSVLRLRTSIRVAVGILLGAVVVAFPSYFSSIFGPPFISLVPLYIGRVVGLSPFLGAAHTAVRQVLYAGIIGCSLSSLGLLITGGNSWAGIGAMTILCFLMFASVYIFDPTFSKMFLTKYAIIDMLFLLVFNNPPTNITIETADGTRMATAAELGLSTTYPPIQMFMVHVATYVVATAMQVLIFPAPTLSWTHFGDECGFVLQVSSDMTDRLLELACLAHPTKHATSTQSSHGNEEGDAKHANGETMSVVVDSNRDELVRAITKLDDELAGMLKKVRVMVLDIKQETWIDAKIIALYVGIASDLHDALAHLHQMRNSFAEGFNERISRKVMRPLVAKLAEFRTEVEFYINDVSHNLSSLSKGRSSRRETSTRRDYLKQVSNSISTEYHQIVRTFENDEQISPTEETSRMNYFLWRLVSLRKTLKRIDKATVQLCDLKAVDTPTWNFIRNVFYVYTMPIFELVEFGTSSVKFLRAALCASRRGDGPTRSETIQSARSKAVTFYKSGDWRFPLRISLGAAALCSLMLYVTNHVIEFDIRPVWSPLTLVVVVQPSLGATITRSIQRLTGTLAGSVAAQITRFLISAFGYNPVGFITMMGCITLFATTTTYIQHGKDKSEHYPFIVAVYAFQVILFGGARLAGTVASSGWSLAMLRCIHVIIGDVVGAFVSLIYSDTSHKSLQANMSQSLIKLSEMLPQFLVHTASGLTHSVSDDAKRGLLDLTAATGKQKSLLRDAEGELVLRNETLSKLSSFVSATDEFQGQLRDITRLIGKAAFSNNHIGFISPLLPLLEQLCKLLQADAVHLAASLASQEQPSPSTSAPQSDSATLESQINNRGTSDGTSEHQQMLVILTSIRDLHTRIRLEKRKRSEWIDYANFELVRWNAYLHVIFLFTTSWAKLRVPNQFKLE